MVEIAAFRGLRYNLEKTGRLEEVTAPPFDVISPEMRDRFHELSPYNVIRLILGKDHPEDGPKNNRYTRAAEFLIQWQKDGILIRDTEPAIYAYYIDFDRKISGKIIRATRKGFVARLRLSPYQKGEIFPHERTLHGPKVDRMNLIKQCRANFSHVFCLSQGKGQDIYSTLDKEIESIDPCQFLDQNGVRHSMWPVTNKRTINQIAKVMKDRKAIIADGHHRYETCLNYLRYLEQKMPLLVGSAQYTIAYFTQDDDPGLLTFPYHRIIRKLPKNRFRGLLKKLEEYFDIQGTPEVNPASKNQRSRFMEKLEQIGQRKPAFGMMDIQKGEGYFLTLKPHQRKKRTHESAVNEATLDVIVLEELILKDILRIPARALFEGKYIVYETDYDQAFEWASTQQGQLIFLMNRIPVDKVIQRALACRVMPEKSTYFYPKLASGIVMNLLDD
jgi:uncharacterized protein (DUF1015 family)